MEYQTNEAQKSITSAIIASFQVTNEIAIIEQSVTKHGRGGTLYTTKFEVQGYNQKYKEVGVFSLQVAKNGKTKLLQFQDATICKAKIINLTITI
jgi:hypothetical protein